MIQFIVNNNKFIVYFTGAYIYVNIRVLCAKVQTFMVDTMVELMKVSCRSKNLIFKKHLEDF